MKHSIAARLTLPLCSLALLAGCGTPMSPADSGTRTLPTALDAQAFNAPDVRGPVSFQDAPPLPPAPLHPPQLAVSGNSAKLYVSPVETEPAVEALINGAQKSLYLEVFNFGTSYADRLVPLLVAKAKQGVEVRLLVDYLGTRFLSGYKGDMDQLKAAGCDVRTWHPRFFSDALGTKTFNITHRKEYLADGQRALVGGVNLMGPFDTTTQDLLIEWRGPVLGELYEEFSRDWSKVGGARLREVPDTTPQGDVDAQVAVTSPFEGRYEIRDAVFKAIDSAQDNILIEQQYFWDNTLMTHLHAAVKRGVKLRVIVPGGEQKVVQKTCNANELNQFVQEGAEAHRYHGVPESAHLHTKYFSVDDRWAITGSCNGDTRSLMDNQELDVITTNPELVAELRQRLFERDWSQFSDNFVFEPSSWYVKPFHSLLDLIDYYF